MARAACKIILCLGALAKVIGDKMESTNERVAERVIERLERLTKDIESMED